jgi:hypothetical protein
MIRFGLNEMALGVVAACGFVMTASASQLPLDPIPVVECREKIGYDVGTIYSVSYDAQNNGYVIEVSQDSIIGPRPDYSATARPMNTGVPHRLTLNYFVQKGRFHERLILTAMNTDSPALRVLRNDEEVRSPFECRKMNAVQPVIERPRPICMAYFTGYIFDATQGTCLRLGASGCSNPFEFTTQQECMDAARDAGF